MILWKGRGDLELDYSGLHNTTMFRVRWAKNVERESRIFTTMTIPDAKSATMNAIGKKSHGYMLST